jgi:DNA-damage-inducible protein J
MHFGRQTSKPRLFMLVGVKERKMREKEWSNPASNSQINGQMYCICIENELDLYKNEVIHMANAVLQTRIDKATKDEAEQLFESLGLDITTAIRLFLKQAINQRCIPFDIVPPQREFTDSTLVAIEEAKKTC